MKRVNKLGVVIIVLAMVAMLSTTAWAAITGDVVLTTVAEENNFCPPAADKTVVLTIGFNKLVNISTIGAQVVLPEGWEFVSLANKDGTVLVDVETGNWNDEKDYFVWFPEEEAVDLAVSQLHLTVRMPAGTVLGEYPVGLTNIEISTNYGGEIVVDGADATTTITVKHTAEVIDAAKAATCTETGLTEGKHCEACGTVLLKQEEIPAKDHKWAEEPTSYTVNEDGTHTANYVCGNDANHTKSDAPVEHTYDQTGNKCVCGAVKPVEVEAKGSISYEVDGQKVTVTHSVACKVGWWDEVSQRYIAIAAVANGDGSYCFTAPAGVTKVLLVVQGDVTGDAQMKSRDYGILKSYVLKSNNTTLTAEQIFAADLNNDGKITSREYGQLKSACLGKYKYAW